MGLAASCHSAGPTVSPTAANASSLPAAGLLGTVGRLDARVAHCPPENASPGVCGRLPVYLFTCFLSHRASSKEASGLTNRF